MVGLVAHDDEESWKSNPSVGLSPPASKTTGVGDLLCVYPTPCRCPYRRPVCGVPNGTTAAPRRKAEGAPDLFSPPAWIVRRRRPLHGSSTTNDGRGRQSHPSLVLPVIAWTRRWIAAIDRLVKPKILLASTAACKTVISLYTYCEDTMQVTTNRLCAACVMSASVPTQVADWAAMRL